MEKIKNISYHYSNIPNGYYKDLWKECCLISGFSEEEEFSEEEIIKLYNSRLKDYFLSLSYIIKCRDSFHTKDEELLKNTESFKNSYWEKAVDETTNKVIANKIKPAAIDDFVKEICKRYKQIKFFAKKGNVKKTNENMNNYSDEKEKLDKYLSDRKNKKHSKFIGGIFGFGFTSSGKHFITFIEEIDLLRILKEINDAIELAKDNLNSSRSYGEKKKWERELHLLDLSKTYINSNSKNKNFVNDGKIYFTESQYSVMEQSQIVKKLIPIKNLDSVQQDFFNYNKSKK